MNFINGQWLEGQGEVFTSIDPSTQNIIWEKKAADKSDVAKAVGAAREAFQAWALTPLDERIDFLKKLQMLIKKNIQEIGAIISQETGKTVWECVMEAQSMMNKIDISIEAYQQRTGESTKQIDTYQLHVRHRPIGVLAIFVPFNFPGHLLNTHVVPALLAGNTVVIKPSELTPKSSEFILNLWQQIGLRSGVINLVQGAGIVGQALAKDPRLNGICFTGSFKIGQLLHQAWASQTEKMLVLEMGGNNPLIIGDISNIDAAVLTIIQSSFISAGQRCTCTRRLIIVENHLTERLLNALVEKLKQIRVNYPLTTPEPFMGPVISIAAGQHVLERQQFLQQLGGKSLLPTQSLDPKNPALLSPGLIDVTGIDVPDEEIFGPLLQIFRVKDLSTAIQTANNTQYGLTAGILSDDKKQYDTFFNLSRAGTVNWNRPTTGISGLAPFGGLGHSGNFRPTGTYAADYCAYPVISVESTQLQIGAHLPPGL